MKLNNELLLLLASYFLTCIWLGRSDDVPYDLCIIGAGMFGSAAAKHASANPSLKVCLIGPNEPIGDEWEHREIFGAHYDESRLIDTIEPEEEIQILARESIKSYRELEKLSGISFYYPVGLLSMGRKQSPWMEQCERGAAKRVKDCVLDLTKRSVFENRFPFISIEEDEYAIFDDTGAGYINPRKMIEAQIKVSKMQGCTLITDVVYEVSEEKDGYHEIFMENGTRVKAKRVLITTGAYTNFKKIDPLPKLQLTPIKETVAMIQIPQDEAQRLSSMPCLIYKKEDVDIMAYIFPPVLYPDGLYYLKIGPLNVDFKKQALYNLKTMKSWYLNDGDQTMVKKISRMLINMLPGLKVENIASATGVTCATVSTLPYIDRISPTVTVATGGNGRGAKICEEVGRIAAHLSLTGQWSSAISQRLFNAIPI